MAISKLLVAFVLLSLALSAPRVAALLPPDQFTAMMDLCALLESPMGWNCTADPCTWPFVSCNLAATSVTQLLNGTGVPVATTGANIPGTIVNLVDLQVLSLKSLGFNGPIPEGVFTLQNLSYLDLSSNMLTGGMPTPQAPSLSYLNIANNGLTGTFPDLTTVPLLSTLILSGNQLDGEVPAGAFAAVPALNHFESIATKFSGSTEAFANRVWDVLVVSGNDFAMCPPPSAAITAATTCDFSSQGTCTGFCYTSWSGCQTTTSDVTCGEPTPTSSPDTVVPEEVTIHPLAHCWTFSPDNVLFALFGYNANATVNSSLLEWNVTNGVLDAYPDTLLAGQHSLSIRIRITDATSIVILGIGNSEQLSVNPTDINNACPNDTVAFVVSYPASTNASFISTTVRNLFSEVIPYPIDHITTRDYNAKRAPGDVEAALHPGQGANPYYGASSLFSDTLPATAETGPSAGPPALISAVPTTGITQPASPITTPNEPPGLPASAKGAIGMAIAIALLIIIIAILLCLSPRAKRLPTVSRMAHDKSVRPVTTKRVKGKYNASAGTVAADPAAAVYPHEETYEHPQKLSHSKSERERVKRGKQEVTDSADTSSPSK